MLAYNNTELSSRPIELQARSSLPCPYALNIFFPEQFISLLLLLSYFSVLSSNALPFKSTFFTFHYVLHHLFPGHRFVGCVAVWCTANKPVQVQVTAELRHSFVTAEQSDVLCTAVATFDDAIDTFV